MGNTVGRLVTVEPTILAYIAGFLDGDGSIMLQLHRREASKDTFRVKTVICFYQDNRHRQEIVWMKEVLACGYVYTRNDQICELRIEGWQRVYEVLLVLEPYLRLKKRQADLLLTMIPQLQQKSLLKRDIALLVQQMRDLNYFSSQRTTLTVSP